MNEKNPPVKEQCFVAENVSFHFLKMSFMYFFLKSFQLLCEVS